MVYDDQRYREEPGYRGDRDTTTVGGARSSLYTAGSYPAYNGATDAPVDPSTVGRRPDPELEYVFDGADAGERRPDRLAVHVGWELLLLLAVAGAGFALYRSYPQALRGGARDDLLLGAAILGLLTVGAGLSLRAAVPNLAVGAVAYAAALVFGDNSGRGAAEAAVLVGAAALTVGLLLAFVVVGLHVPAWAASLGLALIVVVLIEKQGPVTRLATGYDPERHALWYAGAVALLAVVGGALGALRPVRRALGGYRSAGDPALRPGGGAAILAGLALVGSTLFAATAGILLALRAGSVDTDPGLTLAGLALGTALLGGTSAYGRRGGVLGTLLAVALLTLVMRYADLADKRIAPLALAAAAIGVGLVATRLVERFGRPRPERRPQPPTEPEPATGRHDPATGRHDPATGRHDPAAGRHDGPDGDWWDRSAR
jgi:ribose/xylose/arabinose/galactoside ABC-type transport system permease subunit